MYMEPHFVCLLNYYVEVFDMALCSLTPILWNLQGCNKEHAGSFVMIVSQVNCRVVSTTLSLASIKHECIIIVLHE